jgi:hypothetical protein
VKGTKYSANKKQFDFAGNGMISGTTSKKTNHSVDLGGRVATNNVAPNMVLTKNG